MTVDRPYGGLLDFLHHRIGSMNVAHHIVARIPHYNAVKATLAIREHLPGLYRYAPTPISLAEWKADVQRNVVTRAGDLSEATGQGYARKVRVWHGDAPLCAEYVSVRFS